MGTNDQAMKKFLNKKSTTWKDVEPEVKEKHNNQQGCIKAAAAKNQHDKTPGN